MSPLLLILLPLALIAFIFGRLSAGGRNQQGTAYQVNKKRPKIRSYYNSHNWNSRR
jgi:hypothetical protein